MLLGDCQKMLMNCSEIYVFELFSLYILLISPSHTVMVTGRFGPAQGILTFLKIGRNDPHTSSKRPTP